MKIRIEYLSSFLYSETRGEEQHKKTKHRESTSGNEDEQEDLK